MTILKLADLDDAIDPAVLIGTESLERRDSLRDSPWTDGTLTSLNRIIDLHTVITDRRSICRNDAVLLSDLATESSILQAHATRYPPAFYTEDLSHALYDVTVASLESSVVKSVSDTLTTITQFIGNHGKSAVSYIRDVFDEDARTNANITKVVTMVEYLDKTIEVLDKSTAGRKLTKDIRHIRTTIYEQYTSKWNGLKDAIASPKGDFATLSEAIAIPIIEVYPKTMDVLYKLMDGLGGANTPAEVDSVIKAYKVPSVDLSKLRKWTSRHIPGNRTTPTDGVVTELQSLAMSARSHIKALENNRNARPSFKADDVLDTMVATEWVTTRSVADDILNKAETLAVDQDRLSADIARLAKATIVDTTLGQQTLPIVLELLSIVRGFGALIDAIGILTVVKRNLINDQLTALSAGIGEVHRLIRTRSSELTVGEITQLNALITGLKSTL